jgi:CRP/FNR family transcriptional regulator, anaerobic regulatory protein
MLMPITPRCGPDDGPLQRRLCAACDLRPSALFSVLDDAALGGIQAPFSAAAAGVDDPIYRRGERGTAVITIRSGLVRFERLTERGNRRIVRLAGPGDLIGLEALLREPYRDDAIACTAVSLCHIPQAVVDELEASQMPLRRELMMRWQHALDAAQAWSAELCIGTARRRLLELLALLDRLGDGAGPVWLPRREDIGAMLDLTFETASRVISQLRREGVLELMPPRHAQLDRVRLAAALREVNS